MTTRTETTDWGDSNTSQSLGYMLPGYTVSGTLSDVSDVDWIRVPMAAEQSYGLSFSGEGMTFSFTDGGESRPATDGTLNHTARHPSSENFITVSGAAGGYTIVADGLAADALPDEAAGGTATTASLLPGNAVGGVINGNDAKKDSDWFELSLNEGVEYSWTMTPSNSVVGATAGGLLTLYDDEGAALTVSDGVNWSGSAWPEGGNLSYTPDADATFYIGAETYFEFNDAGSYVLDMTTQGQSLGSSASVGGATVAEGDGDTSSAEVTITLDEPSSNPMVVSYRTVDGTATASADFKAVEDGRLTFNTGETSKTVAIDVSGDTQAEDDETFHLMLTGTNGGDLSAEAGILSTVTITDDDTAGSNSEPDTDNDGNGGGFQFFDMAAVDQVTAVYIGYFGRAPDSEGMEFWVRDLNEDVSPETSPSATAEEMASGFRFSDETQDIYPFLDPNASQNATEPQVAAFVDDVFENLFNRTPETEGSNFWVGEIQERLSDSQTIGDIIVDVMAGAGGVDVNVLQNKINVAKTYTEENIMFDVQESVEIIGSVALSEESVSQALEKIG